ncbi:MAG: glycosyltransferase [Acidobacteriaceae bacterium]
MKAQRNILIIVQNLPVPFDRRVWLEATSLRKAGFGVAVICPKKKIYTKGYEQLDGVDIYRYPMIWDADKATAGFFAEFLCCWLATLWLAIRAFCHRPFHAIHACNPPDTYFALAMLFRPLGVKFIFDHHDLCPEMYVAKGNPPSGLLYRGLLLLERLTLRSAHAVIAVNQSHRDIAIRRGKIPAEKITIVRSGPLRFWSEVDAFNPELKQGRPYMAICLGEMGAQDGVDLLLHTIRHYADSHPKEVLFTFIGGGPELQRMQKLAHELMLDDWTCFTGRITDEKILWQYLATADVCVAPDPLTEYGNMSTANKIMEYMAFGKPVVAFALTEHRRSAAEAAEYVEPNNPGKLSNAIHDLLIDEDRRRQMGRMGRDRFRAGLAWENSEKELVALYSRLLGIEQGALTRGTIGSASKASTA